MPEAAARHHGGGGGHPPGCVTGSRAGREGEGRERGREEGRGGGRGRKGGGEKEEGTVAVDTHLPDTADPISPPSTPGPSALGHIPGYLDTVFPSQSLGYLALVANIGLVLYLFLVGVELDPEVPSPADRGKGAAWGGGAGSHGDSDPPLLSPFLVLRAPSSRSSVATGTKRSRSPWLGSPSPSAWAASSPPSSSTSSSSRSPGKRGGWKRGQKGEGSRLLPVG
jgi:hypothetical protein